MKRINMLFITAVLFITASFSISTANANGDGKLDEILDNMQKNAASIKTIYAKMEQVKRDRSIGGAEKYSGEIFFKHVGKNNDKVRINYSVPKGQTLWIEGAEITLYQEALKQAIITSRRAAAAKGDEFAFVATPYTSVPDLKRQYNIVYVGEEQGMAKLDLTPKGKSSLRKLTLWVDQSSWLPTKSQVTEANNNETTFTLSGVKQNSVISDGTFKVKLPGGTKTIRK
ncbi:MAG TPA: outer membrane lipoprotein carrier protein LolA [Blastocatellia bacterium]|nr:outer membrane lipoprotein carrier protein LolA [Blastocatellia bacterium]